MEECFILMLMALSIAGVVRRSSVLLGVSVGLLLVTKVDTIVWIACLACVSFFRRQPSLCRSMIIALGVSLPWIVFSLFEFGTLVPHTILAKQIAYAHEPSFRIVDAFLLAVPDGLRGQSVMVGLFALMWYSIIVLTLWSIVRRKDWLYLVFPLYCVAYTCALLFSGTSIGLWARWTVPCGDVWFSASATSFTCSRPGSTVWAFRNSDGKVGSGSSSCTFCFSRFHLCIQIDLPWHSVHTSWWPTGLTGMPGSASRSCWSQSA